MESILTSCLLPETGIEASDNEMKLVNLEHEILGGGESLHEWLLTVGERRGKLNRNVAETRATL